MAKKVSFAAKPPAKPTNLDEWVGVGQPSENVVNQPEPEKPKMKRMTYDIPESLHRRLKLHCVTNGCQMTDILRKILEDYLNEAEKP